MLFMVPLFAALAARLRRGLLIPAVYGIFIACIGGLWLWLESGALNGMPKLKHPARLPSAIFE